MRGSGSGTARTLRHRLPYAGITRIRFKGFSRGSSQCANAHPQPPSTIRPGPQGVKIRRRTGGRADQPRVQICTDTWLVEFEWDSQKAASNLSKHGVRFAEAVTVLEDQAALSMVDDNSQEERFVALGMDSLGRILVVICATRGDRIRIISARKATRRERSQYERVHR